MKLPIGIQTFSEIRKDNYIYIDKTKEAHELIDNYKYIFLSRPRRFGKSLFLDTLKNIFEGKKEYFKNLYMYDKHDFNDTYPVIKISFSGELFTKEGIIQAFEDIVRYNEHILKIKCDKNQNPSSCFKTLLLKSYEKNKKPAVILIDEYDKPLLDNLTNKEMAEFAKNSLRAFYSIIKDNDQYIKFTFITGVSKFSKVSLFSGLNNLNDISLDPKFGNICGYTQEDIETSFKPLLPNVDLQELKTWYNGYNFLKDKVYNPFDILLFIDKDFTYENYWFETATPSFLLQLIKKNNYYLPNLENITVGKELLNSFDIDNIDIKILLFQTGYLTIKNMQRIGNKIFYNLKIPNLEVQMSLNDAILNMFIDNSTKRIASQTKAYLSLRDANLEDFKQALKSLFASIPYENYKRNNIQIYEGYYASVVYAYLSSLGFPIHVEESTNRGRLDMSILINNNRYIFEFKMDNKENPLQQIKEMKYYEKYLDEDSNIYLVRINFSSSEKNVIDFKTEELHILL